MRHERVGGDRRCGALDGPAPMRILSLSQRSSTCTDLSSYGLSDNARSRILGRCVSLRRPRTGPFDRGNQGVQHAIRSGALPVRAVVLLNFGPQIAGSDETLSLIPGSPGLRCCCHPCYLGRLRVQVVGSRVSKGAVDGVSAAVNAAMPVRRCFFGLGSVRAGCARPSVGADRRRDCFGSRLQGTTATRPSPGSSRPDARPTHGIRNSRRTPVGTPGAAVMDRSCGAEGRVTVRECCYAEALRGSRAARTRSRPKMNSSAGS